MKRAEESLQRQLVAYLRATLPKPWLVFAIPNGGGRSKAEAGILKATGVLAGVPDLLVVGPRSMADHTILVTPFGRVETWPQVIALELKAPPKMLQSGKTSKAKPSVSEAQRDVIAELGECGIPTLIVRDLDEAVEALKNLGVPLRGRMM